MSDLQLHFVSSHKSALDSQNSDRNKNVKNTISSSHISTHSPQSRRMTSTLRENERMHKNSESKPLSGKDFYEAWNAPWDAGLDKGSNGKKGGNSRNPSRKEDTKRERANESKTISSKHVFDSESDSESLNGHDDYATTNDKHLSAIQIKMESRNESRSNKQSNQHSEFYTYKEDINYDDNDDFGEDNENNEYSKENNADFHQDDVYDESDDSSLDNGNMENDTKLVSTWDNKEDKKARKKRRMATISDYIRKEDVELNKQNERLIQELDTNDFRVRKAQDVLFSNVTFAELEGKLNKGLFKNLTQFMKLEKLTFIQERSFLPIVEGKDVLIKSETGSGKTMAYLLPIIQSLSELSAKQQMKREQGTYAFIIAPTRELCIQIQRVANTLTSCFPWMVTSTVMGGDNPQKEKKRLRKGVMLLIATPGRLEDHIKNTKSFVYDNLRHIVMDEADRLLDLGFESTLKTIYHILAQKGIITSEKKPQTVLASATLTSKIRQLASWTLKNEVYAGFTQQELQERAAANSSNEFTIPDHLHQHFMIVPCKLRLPALISILTEKTSEAARNIAGQEKASKMIVFFSSCSSVDFHYQLMTTAHTKRQVVAEDGTIAIKKKKILPVKLYKLHGDMPQTKRTEVYFNFLEADEGILFCTDVAARGLDMPKTDWIIQYDSPGDPKEYLHRVGRTARLGFQGNSCLFLMPHEASYIKLLRKYGINIRKINTEVALENLAFLTEKKSNDIFEMCASVQIQMEAIIKDNEKLHIAAAQAFQDYVKSYATHGKTTKFIFHPKSLHLGHLATSFGLKESPSEIKKLTVGRNRKEQKEIEVESELAKRGFDVELGRKRRGGRMTVPDENQICARIEKKQRAVKLSVSDRIKLYKDFQKNPSDNSIRPKIDVKAILQGGSVPTSTAAKNVASFSALLSSNKRKREGEEEKPKKKTKFTFSTKK